MIENLYGSNLRQQEIYSNLRITQQQVVSAVRKLDEDLYIHNKYSIQAVIAAVMKVTGISFELLESNSRNLDVVEARKLIYVCLKEIHGFRVSFNEMGVVLGGQTVATVRHNQKDGIQLLKTNARFIGLFEEVKQELNKLKAS